MAMTSPSATIPTTKETDSTAGVRIVQIAIASDSEHGDQLVALDSEGRIWERLWQQRPEYKAIIEEATRLTREWNASDKTGPRPPGAHQLWTERFPDQNTHHHVWVSMPLPNLQESRS